MAFVPCVALVTWASWEYVQRGSRDEAGLRLSFRELAEDVAKRSLIDLLEHIDRVAATAANPQELDSLPGVTLAFVPTAHGRITSSFAAPSSTVSPAVSVDARLLEARRLELVSEDLDGAERVYRDLIRGGGTKGVMAEANTGLVAVLLKRQRYEQADIALNTAISVHAIEADQAAVLALTCAKQRLSPDLIQSMVTLLTRREGDPEFRVRIQQVLDTHTGEMSAAVLRQYRQLIDATHREERFSALDLAVGTAIRSWLIERAGDGAAGWIRTPRGEIFRSSPANRAIISQIDSGQLRSLIELELVKQPSLVVLARTYQDQHGRPISDVIPYIHIDAPWGESIQLQVPKGDSVSLPLLSTQHILLIMVVLALLMMISGFVFLYRTARRDIESMQRRSDFVSNVSHELKTPLSLVRMFGEMLSLDYARDEAERKSWYGIIVQESTRLSHLIANVLDFAAMEKGTKRYISEPVDLTALIRSLHEAYRPQLDRTGFTVTADLSPALVLGDQGALTQVFINLLTNAMQYSTERKDLTIVVRREGADAILMVTDHGIGIAPEFHRRIFESFYRVESGLTRETRGTGIGLSLVRAIVEAHHGRIEVESALGCGSTFRVRLPAVEPT